MMKIRHVVLALMVLLNIALLALAWRVVTNRRAEATRPAITTAAAPSASVQPVEQAGQTPETTAGDPAAPAATARGAFALAEPLAHSWAGDAVLLRARGDWPQGSFNPELPNWVFVFYSAGQQATAQVHVVGSEVWIAATGAAPDPFATLTAEQWQVDSDTIVTRFLEGAGGELFIGERQDVTMVLTLTMGETAIWKATLIDWETGDVFGRDFDAHSGFLAPEL